MRTGILSHSYQPCWTIINSPWLPAGQEPVSVQHWLQHRSPLTLQVSWLVEGFEEEGASFTEKKCSNCQSRTSLSVWLQHRLSRTQSPAACKIGKAAPEEGSHCWSTKHCDQLQKGFEQWTSCQRQTRRVQPLQCTGAVTDIHFLFWSSGDSWECVSRRSVTFWYGQCAFFIIPKQQPHWSFWGVVIPSLRQHLCKSNLQICPECWPTLQ